MKKFLIFAIACLLLGAACWLAPAPPLQAQYMGTVAQQTVTQTFTATFATSGTGSQSFNIQNLGQAAHQVTYLWDTSVGLNSSAIYLEGSGDGSHWVILAAGVSSVSNTQSFVANGYFTYLKLVVNPNGQTLNAGSNVSIQYAGYQTPLPVTNASEPVSLLSVTGYAQLVGVNEQSDPLAPEILESFSCSNPGASTAYLEVTSSGLTPTLGSATILFEAPISASGTFSYTGPPMGSGAVWWLGAATTAGGGTAVSTALRCTAAVNQIGPFGPYLFPAT